MVTPCIRFKRLSSAVARHCTILHENIAGRSAKGASRRRTISLARDARTGRRASRRGGHAPGHVGLNGIGTSPDLPTPQQGAVKTRTVVTVAVESSATAGD
jgi:hypothetical protein